MTTPDPVLDYWGEDAEHPLETWRYEVANDDTRLGYWDWVKSRRSEQEDGLG